MFLSTLLTCIQIGLQELYRKKPGMSMEEARKPENLPRNRYRDILPCKNKTSSLDLQIEILSLKSCAFLVMTALKI